MIGRAWKHRLWRVPRYKRLSIGVVLLGLVPASRICSRPAAEGINSFRRLSIAIQPALRALHHRLRFDPVRGTGEFNGHAAFRRMPQSWEF